MTWNPDAVGIDQAPHGWATLVRFWLRAIPFGIVCFGSLGILLILRQPERWIYGMRRPVTPYLTQFVCRMFFAISGLRLRVTGRPMTDHGAIVSNHASWTDIFALHAAKRVFFVSKAEVRGWFGIGWLARATGTIFINRVRGEAKRQQQYLSERLALGHKLLFFPEGTSTDAMRVLPFKTTLFAAFFEADLHRNLKIQPVTVIYRAPPDKAPTFYGWWGDMSFGWHLVQVLGASPQGAVEVIYHPPVKVADYPDRKALARACERIVRDGMPAERQISG
ncbi:acyltransferase, putative [Pseudooceanicola batsensis HTCC2597]|uniref:Acyltransferase, putative n=1 Tax=Pseudooceanicola batsensis (strain ATCC BAA-863 / DSM 15984 / KCTC 12145 / HTCC2597) TaxID=252305 RepID=A3TXH2_PSEBH|nr:lysophospholipid acyltransferase family protein [Pseudooceanicola batsensis]EAQ03532.1 acyltransferase, putative [Pseudooceanicola batsensis HTCC2597]